MFLKAKDTKQYIRKNSVFDNVVLFFLETTCLLDTLIDSASTIRKFIFFLRSSFDGCFSPFLNSFQLDFSLYI